MHHELSDTHMTDIVIHTHPAAQKVLNAFQNCYCNIDKQNTNVLSFSQTESERASHRCTSTKLHSSSLVEHSQSLTKHLSIAVCDCNQNPKLPKGFQHKPPTREADSRAAILPPQFFKCGGKTATGLGPRSKNALGPKFYKRSRPQALIKTATSQSHEAL